MLTLPQDHVHIWSLSLALSEEEFQQALTIIAPEERERLLAKRADLARLAIASRYYCRQVLSLYLNIDPQLIDFQYGAHGKPNVNNSLGIEFNVSHKENQALIAIASKSIGIDLEHRRPRDFLGLARRYFADDERQMIESVTGVERAHRFYRIWTQKEAFIKTFGKTIFSDLRRFSVSSKESGGLIRWEDGHHQDWFCRTWALEDDYQWALMTPAPVTEILFHSGLAGSCFSL